MLLCADANIVFCPLEVRENFLVPSRKGLSVSDLPGACEAGGGKELTKHQRGVDGRFVGHRRGLLAWPMVAVGSTPSVLVLP